MSENHSPLKQILYTALICMAAAAIAIIGWKLLMPKGDTEANAPKTIEVQVVHGDGSTRDFTLNTEAEDLGTALIENSVVEDNQGPYGLYILTADGETASESKQEWWQITRGGERLNTGADSTPIADGEHYELTFTVGYD